MTVVKSLFLNKNPQSLSLIFLNTSYISTVLYFDEIINEGFHVKPKLFCCYSSIIQTQFW